MTFFFASQLPIEHSPPILASSSSFSFDLSSTQTHITTNYFAFCNPKYSSVFKPHVADAHEVDTDIERRSLLETNGDSSEEEESDATNGRNTEINVKSTTGCPANDDDELKEVKVLDEVAGGEDGEQPNQSGARLQSESVLGHENMIQFDAEADAKPSEELKERSQKDFLTIDLGESEFGRSYTDGCVNGVSSSLKSNELLNKLNISNISNITDILNASNNSRNSIGQNKSANEESSDTSDEIEIFNKNQLEHASHNRTI